MDVKWMWNSHHVALNKYTTHILFIMESMKVKLSLNQNVCILHYALLNFSMNVQFARRLEDGLDCPKTNLSYKSYKVPQSSSIYCKRR